VVDALNHDADRCRDEHRFERAAALYEEALARDPHDWHASLDHARIDLWYGNRDRGRAALEGIAGDEQAPQTWRDRAQEMLADDDLVGGRADDARAAYRALAARTPDEDAARTLEVKALAVDDPRGRRAVIELLIGSRGRPVDSWLGALYLGLWAEWGHDPLAGYLVGRNLAPHDQYARAAEWLDGALDRGVPSQRVRREILRQRAIDACALRDAEGLARVKRLVEERGSPFEGSAGGRKEWVLRLIGRCAGG
jgi:hypothetical protein